MKIASNCVSFPDFNSYIRRRQSNVFQRRTHLNLNSSRAFLTRSSDLRTSRLKCDNFTASGHMDCITIRALPRYTLGIFGCFRKHISINLSLLAFLERFEIRHQPNTGYKRTSYNRDYLFFANLSIHIDNFQYTFTCAFGDNTLSCNSQNITRVRNQSISICNTVGKHLKCIRNAEPRQCSI